MKLRVYGVAVATGLMTAVLAESAHAQMRDTVEKISGNAVNEGVQDLEAQSRPPPESR